MEIKVRHIRCNMADFNADRHRFRFFYNGAEHIASCYMGCDIHFDEITKQTVPQNILLEVGDAICESVAKNESKWHYPEEAYAIADAYCAEEFK